MSNKVRISYTIDLAAVPLEVVGLLSEIYDMELNLEENLDLIKERCESNNIVDVLKDIDSLRQKLMRVDLRLGDVTAILEGYQKALAVTLMNESDQQTMEENKGE